MSEAVTPVISEELSEAEEQEQMNEQAMLANVAKLATDPEIIRVSQLQPKEQEKEDQVINDAVDLFFNNKFQEAEALFELHGQRNPLAAVGAGALSFIKATMSFSEQDMNVAIEHFNRADTLASAIIRAIRPPEAVRTQVSNLAKTGVSSLARMGGSTASYMSHLTGLSFVQTVGNVMTNVADTTAVPFKEMTNAEFRSTVIKGEASLLIAIAQLFQESMIAYVRAGLSFRRGFKCLDSAYEQIRKRPDYLTQFDKDSIGAVNFGIGVFNVAFSVLPTKIKNYISAFGFPSDRVLGLDLLNEAFHSTSPASGLASLFLLGYNVQFATFAPSILGPTQLPRAEQVMEESLKRHPDSALHKCMHGRLYRLKRDNDNALKSFQTAVESPLQWRQFMHLCYYDLAVSHCFALEWKEAMPHVQTLADENFWSKAYYMYQIGMIHQVLGENDKAKKTYDKVAPLVHRKFGGRTIQVETFVLKKAAYQLHMANSKHQDYCRALREIHGLEFILMWNGFSTMSSETLQKCQGIVDTMLPVIRSFAADQHKDTDDAAVKYSDDHLALACLIKGILFKELGDHVASETFFEEAYEFKSLATNTYIRPFTVYEMALLKLAESEYKDKESNIKEAKRLLMVCRDDYSDYYFENRLNLRVHLVLSHLALNAEK